jgi:hypothetical protein
VFVHVLIRGGDEFADRSRRLGLVSGYSNAQRQLVAGLLSSHGLAFARELQVQETKSAARFFLCSANA